MYVLEDGKLVPHMLWVSEVFTHPDKAGLTDQVAA